MFSEGDAKTYGCDIFTCTLVSFVTVSPLHLRTLPQGLEFHAKRCFAHMSSHRVAPIAHCAHPSQVLLTSSAKHTPPKARSMSHCALFTRPLLIHIFSVIRWRCLTAAVAPGVALRKRTSRRAHKDGPPPEPPRLLHPSLHHRRH